MRTLHWFRNDLRLQDNPALLAACQQGEVLPVFILDTDEPVRSVLGGASRAWLHQSLTALDASLNNNLVMLKGSAQTLIPDLCARYQIEAVTWNRGYEPWTIQRDSGLKTALKANGLSVTSYNGALLFEPWDTVKKDGYPYRVYTPFYKHCMANLATRTPGVLNTARIQVVPHGEQAGLESLALRPKVAWDEAMLMDWAPGEQGAQGRLQHFLATGMGDYREGRDFPAKRSVSGLSAHLHFGEISPHQILASVRAESPADDNQTHFIKELVWREFSYNLLYHFPTLQEKNLQAKFDHFPWETDETFLKAWQTGQTGYPIVDAGMRELRQTGSMHNRVRMIVASFLIKNLKLHWHHGERWFWDCLVDADLASNSASWQWCAGSGADAAPYFRIFNPITQGQRFDPDGAYTRRYVPELKRMPSKYLYEPWACPVEISRAAGVVIGKDYPAPIVEVKASREAALAAFSEMKRRAES